MSALSSSVLLGALGFRRYRGRSAPFLLGMNSDQTRYNTTTALFLETCDAPPRLPMLPTPRHYSPSVDGAMVTGTPTARPGPLSPSRVLPMLTPLALLVAGQAGDKDPCLVFGGVSMHACDCCMSTSSIGLCSASSAFEPRAWRQDDDPGGLSPARDQPPPQSAPNQCQHRQCLLDLSTTTVDCQRQPGP